MTGADEAVIVDLYTSPDSRGRGIASALIAAACRQRARESFRAVYATVEVRTLGPDGPSSEVAFGRSVSSPCAAGCAVPLAPVPGSVTLEPEGPHEIAAHNYRPARRRRPYF